MSHYRFVTEWQADAPVERVWDVLLDQQRWPDWWRGFRSAELLEAGGPSGRGMRIRQGWRGWLPYTLTIDVEIVDLERHRLLQGRAGGDMEGTCTWTFDPIGDRTTVRFVMDVRPARWWMNLPLPFAGRVVAANFDAIMRWGEHGLTRVLAGLEAAAPAATTLASA